MSPVGGEADAVRLVEDVIEATSVSHACMCHVPTTGTGAAILKALVEAGWVAPYSVAEPTEPGAQVRDRAGDVWTRTKSGAWRLLYGRDPIRWWLLVSAYGPIRLASPKAEKP